MPDTSETYVFLAPELERLLSENEIGLADLLAAADARVPVALRDDPSEEARGKREPVTVILASAAVIAALTPALKEVIRRIARRDPVIRDRVLVPAESSTGEIVRNEKGEPILHWVDKAVGLIPDTKLEPTKISGIGFEISLGGEK